MLIRLKSMTQVNTFCTFQTLIAMSKQCTLHVYTSLPCMSLANEVSDEDGFVDCHSESLRAEILS